MSIFSMSIFSSYCDETDKPAYELVNDKNGFSYIQINEDLESFSFKSDFKSIGNSGKVGFFIYPNGLDGDELKKYIDGIEVDAKFSKKVDNGLVDLGSLKAGDKVGFYLDRKNGDVIRTWNFENFHNITYIAFDKNGGGKDEWMSMVNITTIPVKAPEGAPLPGTWFMIGIGTVSFLLVWNKTKRTIPLNG